MTTAHAIREISAGTWEINDFDCSSMFLLEGKERALLIDTGIGIGDLPAVLSDLTSKPVTLALSHNHLDHIGGMGGFPEAFLNRDDWFTIFRLVPDLAGRRGYAAFIRNRSRLEYDYHPETDILPWPSIPRILPLIAGQVFDLGGRQVSVHACPCHTAGSMIFLDNASRILFAGDAVNGNMLLSGNPCAADFVSIERALNSYQRLKAMSPQYNRIFNGHADFREFGEALNPQMLQDLLTCCADLVSGNYEETWEPCMFPGHPDETVIRRGLVKVVYCQDGIREKQC